MKCSNFNVIAKKSWVFYDKVAVIKKLLCSNHFEVRFLRNIYKICNKLSYICTRMKCVDFLSDHFSFQFLFYLIILANNFAIIYYQLISVTLRPQVFYTKSWKQQEHFIPLLNFYELILYTLYIYIICEKIEIKVVFLLFFFWIFKNALLEKGWNIKLKDNVERYAHYYWSVKENGIFF